MCTWHGAIARLKELKEKPDTSTWFKDHISVFSDPHQLGEHNISIAEDEKEEFMLKVYRPYIQSVIDHVSTRLRSSDVYSCFSVFDPQFLPANEGELSSYGEPEMKVLTDFCGRAQSVSFEGETNRSIPDIDGDEAKAEWRFFRKVLFKEYSNISMNKVFSNLLTNDTIRAAFPNLSFSLHWRQFCLSPQLQLNEVSVI